MAVADEDVEQAIIVEVEDLGAEAQREKPGGKTGFGCEIFEDQPAPVAKQRIVLARKCGQENVGEAIAVIVGNFRAHSGQRLAVHIEAHARAVSDIHETTVTPIVVQEIADAIVGDENVRPAVPVDIARLQLPGLSRPDSRHLLSSRRP